MKKENFKKLGLVLSGGGARGAYEAGVLHYIRTVLPSGIRERAFQIHCGTSIGAINTCFLAGTAQDPIYQGKQIKRIWENLRIENIYERDLKAFFSFICRASTASLFNFFRPTEQRNSLAHFPGFLNTAPFEPFIEKIIPWKQIRKNIQSKTIDAVSIVTTNVFTGRMELFLEKHPEVRYTGQHTVHETSIKPIHAIASSAIPVIFPPAMINGTAYVDGGLRLNTPFSPAIQLGAESILVIGLNHRSKPGEPIPFSGLKGVPPSLGQILGRVMNALFLDKTQFDMEQVQRINNLIEWSEMMYGDKYLQDLNKMIRDKKIPGDIPERGLKKIKIVRIRPSQDIGGIFSRCYKKEGMKYFSQFEKFLIRFLDIDPLVGVDFLSYISFMPTYLHQLIDLGFEDARTQHDSLMEFFESSLSGQ